MSDPLSEMNPADAARAQDRMLALTTWENEAGTGLAAVAADGPLQVDAEAQQLRVRVIALENLIIALLADATDQQRALARDMGSFISPRPGYTPHPMTLRAAEAMHSLLERADRFRTGPQA